MPRYDYACDVCGHRFEATHSITDDALSVCPECGGSLRRVIGAVGVAFKGSGFYRTDSRAAAKSRATSGKSSSGSAAGKSSGSASSSTPSDSPSTAPAPSATAPSAPAPAAMPTKPSSDS